MPKTFNHAYDLAFAVSDSGCEDGHDALLDSDEQEKILKALQERVDYLRNDRQELVEALGCFDSFEENS